MHRLLARGIAAAALTTAALVALPQAAFANQTAPGGGDSIPVSALVAPQTDPAAVSAAPAPRVRTSDPSARRAPTTPERTTAPANRSTATTSSSTAASTKAAPTKSAPAPAKTPAASTGSDISYPQCSLTPPSNQLFGVIGVNGGTAKDFNPCLAKQFAWASATLGGTPQGRASLYINTANPAGQGSWWPTSDSDRPAIDPAVAGPTTSLSTAPVTYPNNGTVGCTASSDPYGPACSYVYGYVRAMQAIEYAKETLGGTSTGTLRWWLDTETSNTWAGSTTANAASLAGAATALARASSDGVTRVGVYSTTAQYTTITGATGAAVPSLPDGEKNPLIGLPEWGAGASNLKGAQSNCGVRPFTGGAITLTQYVSGSFDFDVSCAGY